MTVLGNKQLGKLIANIKALSSIYTEEKIPNVLIKDILNEVVDELNSISGTKDKDSYRESYVIPQLTSVIITNADSTSYTSSNRRLVIPASGDNITWTNETEFTSEWIGGTVVFENILRGIRYNSTIESVVNATTIVLSATDAYLPSADLDDDSLGNITITLDKSQTNSIPIGSMSVFKYIDYITSIEDTLTSEVIKVTEKEFNQLSRDGSYSVYANSIIWTLAGDTLKFKKGANVSVYGTRTMNIIRTPKPMTTNTDYIDVKPSVIAQVISIALYRILKAMRVQPIPGDVQEAQTNLEKQKRAFVEEKTSEKEAINQ